MEMCDVMTLKTPSSFCERPLKSDPDALHRAMGLPYHVSGVPSGSIGNYYHASEYRSSLLEERFLASSESLTYDRSPLNNAPRTFALDRVGQAQIDNYNAYLIGKSATCCTKQKNGPDDCKVSTSMIPPGTREPRVSDSIWDVNDAKLPKVSDFDAFNLWPQGHCRMVYFKRTSDAVRRHTSGWAMRNTNNHNSQILKKSCLGVLICDEPNCDIALRPAICDKARRRQEGRSCVRTGCKGTIYLRGCRGHGGYPVTHFWREVGDTVFFQAKGNHDHIRPNLKPVRRGKLIGNSTENTCLVNAKKRLVGDEKISLTQKATTNSTTVAMSTTTAMDLACRVQGEAVDHRNPFSADVGRQGYAGEGGASHRIPVGERFNQKSLNGSYDLPIVSAGSERYPYCPRDPYTLPAHALQSQLVRAMPTRNSPIFPALDIHHASLSPAPDVHATYPHGMTSLCSPHDNHYQAPKSVRLEGIVERIVCKPEFPQELGVDVEDQSLQSLTAGPQPRSRYLHAQTPRQRGSGSASDLHNGSCSTPSPPTGGSSGALGLESLPDTIAHKFNEYSCLPNPCWSCTEYSAAITGHNPICSDTSLQASTPIAVDGFFPLTNSIDYAHRGFYSAVPPIPFSLNSSGSRYSQGSSSGSITQTN